MAVFNGQISGVGAPALSHGSTAPIVVEFVDKGLPPLKIGDTISGRIEADGSSYRLRFAYRGANLVQPLRGNGIVPGGAAFTVVAAQANGFVLQALRRDEPGLRGATADRQGKDKAGSAPANVGATRQDYARTNLPAAAAGALPPRPGGEGKSSGAALAVLTKSDSPIRPSPGVRLAAAKADLLPLQHETGAALAAQRREGLPAVGALKIGVNNGPAPASGQLPPTFTNSARTDETMSGIDLQSILPRAGYVTTDFSAVRIEVAQAKDLGLKGGEVVQGVVERDGEGLRFSFDLSGRSVSIPLQGKELPPGKTVLTLAATDPGRGWLRPGSITPAPVYAGAAQYINESMTPASLLLRPQNAEALAAFLAPANLNRLITDPGIAEFLLPLLKNRLTTGRFGPSDVKSVFESCGIWAEGMLAQGKQLRKCDVKSALQGVLNANREGLADLATLDQFSGALDAIESAQVQAAQAQIKGELLFSFFIPFADANPVKVGVSRAAPTELQPAPPLIINLYTKNDSLGEVWLKTQIEKNAEIEVVMWAVESRVVSAASASSRRLLEHFREFGLQLKKISIVNGARPESAVLTAAAGQLVNVQI